MSHNNDNNKKKSGQKGKNNSSKFGNEPPKVSQPPLNEDGRSGEHNIIDDGNPVTPTTLNPEIMGYFETFGAQLTAVANRMEKVEKGQLAWRRSRKGKKNKHNGGTRKKLIEEFDKEADEKTQETSEPEVEKEEESQGQVSSELRPTSVFNRIGAQLTEHDLRLKLEKMKAERQKRRSSGHGHGSERPPSHREGERSSQRDLERSQHKKKGPVHDEEGHSSATAKLPSKAPPSVRVGDLKIEELKKLMDKMDTDKSTINPVGTFSPFTQEIRTAPLPPGFRTNPDLTFKGDTDPAAYLIRFNTEMEVYQVSLEARCRLFAASLRGSAQQWFSKLGAHVTIDSWEQFADIFIKQFQSSMLYAPPVATLANIRQREGETLQDYFIRFNAEVPRVRGATDEAVKNFLIAGLKEGTKFWKHLQAQTPSTLADFYAQAEPFKWVEKSMQELKKSGGSSSSNSRGKGSKRKKSWSPRRSDRRRSESPRRDRNTRERSPQRERTVDRKEHTYTPLVASIEHIYAINANKGMFKKPPPLSRFATRDTRKYCDFHEQTGHETADCWQLKEQIEDLIRNGKLTEWVVREVKKHGKKGLGYNEVPPPGDKNGDEQARTTRAESIHVIMGGPHIGGNSNKAMERYAREAKGLPLTNVHHLHDRPPHFFKGENADILFTEEDAKWVHHPHADALVVKVKIGTNNIHRVLVDNGSAANILTYDVYGKMGLLDKDLSPPVGHLYGFTGASVAVKGIIRLPVTLGNEPCFTTQVATFTVVDQPCAYNAILGRPILKEMKIVTSIYALTMKFPTPKGVGCVKGVQYDSRDCYNKALKAASKGDVPIPEDMDIEGDSSKKRKGSINIISIEELPEGYFENQGIHVEPIPGALMMEASQPVMTLQEGIVEEASDEDETPEQIAMRARKGKGTRKETSTLVDLPGGITRETTFISENWMFKDDHQHGPEHEPNSGVVTQEVGEPSNVKDLNIDLDPRIPEYVERAGAAEDTISILVDAHDSSKVLKIGSQLSPELRERLTIFLKANLDVFAWSHDDMVGIDPKVMCHRLNIDPDKKGVRQKRRPVSGERAEALKEEVDRLLQAGLVKESFYPMWLANPVLVKKPNGKWRTCVDFTDLNKACPKDSFPLPRIDQLVDATAGHALLSFMDAYSGYNQIPMYGPDQEHTSFITDRGLYCYIGMPFGLLNAGATYQRLVNMMFEKQIGKTMEVYVDDMLVKSMRASDHIDNLAEMFDILRKYRMKLNPQKCVFGVESGKFLGFIVNHRGIEANPAKIQALMNMRSPRSVKEVQSLTGRIAALNRFVSKSSDKCHEFFKAIKKVGKKFEWTPECEEAFHKIKEHLGKPPLLSKPKMGETLIIYLAVSEHAISAVLVREEEGIQYPVYYVSKRMLDAETRYTNMEKLAYALILASRKLRPYFQAHKIEVRTAYPLRQIMHKPETSGRLLKWTIELSQFDVDYKPRGALKGQALADFILEFPPQSEEDSRALIVIPEMVEPLEDRQNCASWWTLYVDGAVNNEGAGAGIELITPEGHKLSSAIHFTFKTTNNEAEYEALIIGLKLALEMKVENLNVYSDSMLVTGHLRCGWQARGPQTELYLKCAQRLIKLFNEVRIEHIRRNQNQGADALAKLGSQREATLLGAIPLEIQVKPSVPEEFVMEITTLGPTWMTPVWDYVKTGTLPQDKKEARRVKYQAARYVIYDEVLYRRGFNTPLLRCVDGEECKYILREVHEGICGNHSGGSSLAQKILRQGYYWPTLKKDAFEFSRACDRCQRYANFSNVPATHLTSLMSPWPFAMWGIDLIGELPKAKGGVKYAVVAVDYFTKWAEAEPLATITAKKLKDFVYRAIVCRYGIPYQLISDNGKQFDSKEMREFCEALGIKKGFSAVSHPQTNGQTEAINKIIKHTLKAKLEESKGNWPEELPKVLWSYNTTPRSTTGETPFSLTYGCEAMVPVEVGSGSFRRDHYDPKANEVNHRLYLDMIEETREDSQARLAAYHQRTARHYNGRVKTRPLRVGDLVLRRVMPNTKVPGHGVFGANWEGPYKVKSVLWEGTYHLTDMNDKLVPRAWNAEHLRKYYQ